MSLFSKSEFNFKEFLVKELGFSKEFEIEACESFINGDYSITVYNTKENKGYDILSMDCKSTNIFKMKFIPKSETLSEFLIKQAMSVDVFREQKI